MSNTISAEEYRRMMGKKEPAKPAKQVAETASTCAKVAKNAKELAEKSKKLDTIQALKAMGNYFELDAKSVNFWIAQMRNSNKI